MAAWLGPLIQGGMALLGGLASRKSPDQSQSNVTRFLSPEQQEELAGLLQGEWTQMLGQDYPVTWEDLRFGIAPALDRIQADAARARRGATLRSVQSGQGERGRYLDHELAAVDRAELDANRKLLGDGAMQLAMAEPAWKQGIMNAMTNFLAAGSGQQQVSQQVPGYGSILGQAANVFGQAYDRANPQPGWGSGSSSSGTPGVNPGGGTQSSSYWGNQPSNGPLSGLDEAYYYMNQDAPLKQQRF